MAKVTFLDKGKGSFTVDTGAGSSALIARTGSEQWNSATVALPKLGGAKAWDVRESFQRASVLPVHNSGRKRRCLPKCLIRRGRFGVGANSA